MAKSAKKKSSRKAPSSPALQMVIPLAEVVRAELREFVIAEGMEALALASGEPAGVASAAFGQPGVAVEAVVRERIGQFSQELGDPDEGASGLLKMG